MLVNLNWIEANPITLEHHILKLLSPNLILILSRHIVVILASSIWVRGLWFFSMIIFFTSCEQIVFPFNYSGFIIMMIFSLMMLINLVKIATANHFNLCSFSSLYLITDKWLLAAIDPTTKILRMKSSRDILGRNYRLHVAMMNISWSSWRKTGVPSEICSSDHSRGSILRRMNFSLADIKPL